MFCPNTILAPAPYGQYQSGAVLATQRKRGPTPCRMTAASVVKRTPRKERSPMDRKAWKLSGLTLALILAVAGVVQTQQHQQHHRGGTQTSQGQMPEASQEAPAPMMQQMQGMMENMQEMMQQMQGMMGRRGGMMAEEDEEDEDGMAGGMMGHGHMMLRKLDRLAEQLNLTQEQQIRFRSI